MSAQQTILLKYGSPDAIYQAKYCAMWDVQKEFTWFPAKRMFINNDFKAKLQEAFTTLQAAGVHTEIKTFDGCYNDRSVRGRDSKSLHAWGMAIDLNASVEKLSQSDTHWSEKFISIMEAAGIYWGGRWISRKDPMHWGMYNG